MILINTSIFELDVINMFDICFVQKIDKGEFKMSGFLGKFFTKVGYKQMGCVLAGGAAAAAATDYRNDSHENSVLKRRDNNNYISYTSQRYEHKQPQHVCQLSASTILYRLTQYKKLFGFGSLVYAFHIYEKWDEFSQKSEDPARYNGPGPK